MAMAVNEKVKGYLDGAGVVWEGREHPETMSSAEEARALGVDPDEVAKTLVLKDGAGFALAVIPGGHRLDMHKAREVMGDNHARLATEDEMAAQFPDFDLGAVPPAPGLLALRCLVDPLVAKREWIVFPAGTHTDSVRMKTADLLGMGDTQTADLVQG
jgi:Ala-tRNA(Pro) deacylase